MGTSARLSPATAPPRTSGARSNGKSARSEAPAGNGSRPQAGEKTRIFIAAENRLLREALSRMLAKRNEMEVVGQDSLTPELVEHIRDTASDILLLSGRGRPSEELALMRQVRTSAPEVRILLLGMNGDCTEFLQCVRAGVTGYLSRDASAEEVFEGVRTVREGGAACSASLCLVLFHYFEREAGTLPSASVRERLGFTRREQQIIPLVAQGLSNKEIANHFCLSEQTVKNHLYRMKQKSGAEDRLGIVRLCRRQGFFV